MLGRAVNAKQSDQPAALLWGQLLELRHFRFRKAEYQLFHGLTQPDNCMGRGTRWSVTEIGVASATCHGWPTPCNWDAALVANVHEPTSTGDARVCKKQLPAYTPKAVIAQASRTPARSAMEPHG